MPVVRGPARALRPAAHRPGRSCEGQVTAERLGRALAGAAEGVSPAECAAAFAFLDPAGRGWAGWAEFRAAVDPPATPTGLCDDGLEDALLR